MRSLKVLLIAFIAMLFANTANAQQKTVQTAIIKTAIYCDHCRHCETCGPQIEKKLLKEKGVQMVVIDEKEMTIRVTYNSKKTDVGTIRKAISNLGYDADDVKAVAVAYERLDGCCKK